MKAIKEKAINSFNSDLNCAQAVLTSYSDDLDFDKEMALQISCGFGAGMGKLQETCGAVTGSFMVLGIHNSKKFPDNGDRKEQTKVMIQDFSKKFKTIHKTLKCGELLNCDLNTDEGQKYFEENNLKKSVCEKCIADSIKIIDQLTRE